MKKLIFLLVYIVTEGQAQSLTPVTLTTQSLRIVGSFEVATWESEHPEKKFPNNPELNFAFAQDDEIMINIQMENKKGTNRIEFIDYETRNILYSNNGFQSLENLKIRIPRTGIYTIQMATNYTFDRQCRIEVQRIPSTEQTRNFNTMVRWAEKYDTTWNTTYRDVLVGYDTTYSERFNLELVKSELSEELILQRTERVHSRTNLSNSNKSLIKVVVPQEDIDAYRQKRIKGWAYWIGVGEESLEVWKSNVSAFKDAATGFAGLMGATPLAGLAIGIITDLAASGMPDDVGYYFIGDEANANNFVSDLQFRNLINGKGGASFGQNQFPIKSDFYIGLWNDNYVQGIDVFIKVSVVWETSTYENRRYIDKVAVPRYERRTYKEPKVTVSRVLQRIE